MAMRYQPVLNPERLQLEPNVYNPEQMDDTGPIMGGGRSFTEQIGLDELIRDIKLRPKHRIFCIGSTILTAAVILVVFGSLLLGFSRVMSDIREDEATAKYGIQLIPNLHQQQSFTLKFLSSDETSRREYADEIRKFLNIYTTDQQERQKFVTECEPGKRANNKWCRLSVRREFQKGTVQCSPRDNFGYDSGEPCILLAFKDEIGWTPQMPRNATKLPIMCTAMNSFERIPVDIVHLPAYEESKTTMGGFPLNKIPSTTVLDDNGSAIIDDDGETLYDLPALVFIKIRAPVKYLKFSIRCEIPSNIAGSEVQNLNEFKGRSKLEFNVFYNMDG